VDKKGLNGKVLINAPLYSDYQYESPPNLIPYFKDFANKTLNLFKFNSKYQIKSVLDIGCGLALDYKYYKENDIDIEYHGIDITEGFINRNKEIFPGVDFRVARAQDIPFDGDSIDLVSVRSVLEHIPDPDPIIPIY